jgi:hypothetical protein
VPFKGLIRPFNGLMKPFKNLRALQVALYKYPGYETGQGWTMKPGSLEGEFWGRFKGILGASPPILAYLSP